MNRKCNLKLGVISILLTLSLNIGTLAMFPNSEHKVSESISGLKFGKKVSTMETGKGGYKITICNDILDKCLNILDGAFIKETRNHKNASNIHWIKHLHNMVLYCNCPPDNFIEKSKLLPIHVKQNDNDNEMHCYYCNSLVDTTTKHCSNQECISHWNLLRGVFRFEFKSTFLSTKPGWRERLCLLPVILLEICKDTKITFYPPAKAWAINQLTNEKRNNWEYIDKLFDGLSRSEIKVSKIKELLESAYDSLTNDDIIDCCRYLYQEDFQ